MDRDLSLIIEQAEHVLFNTQLCKNLQEKPEDLQFIARIFGMTPEQFLEHIPQGPSIETLEQLHAWRKANGQE